MILNYNSTLFKYVILAKKAANSPNDDERKLKILKAKILGKKKEDHGRNKNRMSVRFSIEDINDEHYQQ